MSSLRQEPAAFTIDVVGEATVSDGEAAAMQQRYLELMRRLAAASAKWPDCPQIDHSPNGKIPRVNLSVKLSSLCARFDPSIPTPKRSCASGCASYSAKRSAVGRGGDRRHGAERLSRIDPGDFSRRSEEDEFRDQPDAAIALQAYLKDSAQDVSALIRWARRQQRRVGVRLVKGAYWDSEIAWAKQKSWPIPVFLDKAATDANYERLSRMLLEGHDVIDAAFGSHNLRSLAHAIVAAKEIGVPANGYEMQMLYGMAEPVRQAIVQNGQRVRVYLPVGELLPGISYLIRRLMENTSNTSFLRQTYAEKKAVESLIKAPVPAKPVPQIFARSTSRREFRNQAPIDFSSAENRERFAAALGEVRGEMEKTARARRGDLA